jgi:hypothetical protein
MIIPDLLPMEPRIEYLIVEWTPNVTVYMRQVRGGGGFLASVSDTQTTSQTESSPSIPSDLAIAIHDDTGIAVVSSDIHEVLNGPCFGPEETIETFTRAPQRLGTEQVFNLVLKNINYIPTKKGPTICILRS